MVQGLLRRASLSDPTTCSCLKTWAAAPGHGPLPALGPEHCKLPTPEPHTLNLWFWNSLWAGQGRCGDGGFTGAPHLHSLFLRSGVWGPHH